MEYGFDCIYQDGVILNFSIGLLAGPKFYD